MARSSRFDSNTDFEILNTRDAINEKLNETPDKLTVLLFNVRYPDSNTLETRMKTWRKTYETDHHVQFYKCIVADGKQDIKDQYNIQVPPTVIFFRKGQELARISDFIESDPNQSDTTDPKQESKDEKRLKDKLTDLCANMKT